MNSNGELIQRIHQVIDVGPWESLVRLLFEHFSPKRPEEIIDIGWFPDYRISDEIFAFYPDNLEGLDWCVADTLFEEYMLAYEDYMLEFPREAENMYRYILPLFFGWCVWELYGVEEDRFEGLFQYFFYAHIKHHHVAFSDKSQRDTVNEILYDALMCRMRFLKSISVYQPYMVILFYLSGFFSNIPSRILDDANQEGGENFEPLILGLFACLYEISCPLYPIRQYQDVNEYCDKIYSWDDACISRVRELFSDLSDEGLIGRIAKSQNKEYASMATTLLSVVKDEKKEMVGLSKLTIIIPSDSD